MLFLSISFALGSQCDPHFQWNMGFTVLNVYTLTTMFDCLLWHKLISISIVPLRSVWAVHDQFLSDQIKKISVVLLITYIYNDTYSNF